VRVGILATFLIVTGHFAAYTFVSPVLQDLSGVSDNFVGPLLIVWGLAYGGVSVSLQTWMIKATPRAVEAASALWVSVFNLAIGLGALTGGVIVDALTLEGVLWLGGACFLMAGLAVWSVRTVGSLR
jgi:predicted MFS family arabinose efflux permease